MNILIISPSYFPLRGGTEQVIFELTKRLIRDNHNVTILTMRWEGLKPFEVINNIEVYRINIIEMRGLTVPIYYLSLLFMAIKLNIRKKFNLIHMFHIYNVGFGGFLIKKALSIPLITTLAGWDTYDPVKKIPEAHLTFVKAAMNTSDIITAPSKHLANAGMRQGCKKEIRVIPHGTGMHQKINSLKIDIKQKYNISNQKVLLSVQRLSSRKGLKYLLQAIPEIITHIKDIMFIIIGKGPEEQNLKNIALKLNIRNHIVFVGFIPDEELPSYYAAADLFVLPTLYEAFGLVYIDALCFGLPIVTTINGGSLDIINKDNGILIPPKDPIKLGEAIIEALNKRWDRDTIKADTEKYKWENIVERYYKLYGKATIKE